jgi:hypothetical protein
VTTTPPATTPQPGGQPDGEQAVYAPGQQPALFPTPHPPPRRWRAVAADGRRLPPVGSVGVALAQTLALARANGAAWILGADEHTVQIRHRSGPVVLGAGPGAPRWARAIAAALPTPHTTRPPHPAPPAPAADSR